MNQYAIRARDHWRTHLPTRYAGAERPGDVLHRPGDQAMEEIEELAEALAGRGPDQGDVPGQDGPVEHGESRRGVDGPAGADPAPGRDRLTPPPTRASRPDRLRAPRFRPRGQADLGPSGTTARIRANLAALRTLRQSRPQDRPATGEEQQVLARWSGWGAVAQAVFEPAPEYALGAATSCASCSPTQEYTAAQQSTLNAHYTDAGLVTAIWRRRRRTRLHRRAGSRARLRQRQLHRLRPRPGARLIGVELEPDHRGDRARCCTRRRRSWPSRSPTPTSRTARSTWPSATCRSATSCCTDPRHNPCRHCHPQPLPAQVPAPDPPGRPGGGDHLPLHLGRAEPGRAGGDGRAGRPGRRGAAAHRGAPAAAGTDVVTDVLILRRRDPDTAASRRPGWVTTPPRSSSASTPSPSTRTSSTIPSWCSARCVPAAACTGPTSSSSTATGDVASAAGRGAGPRSCCGPRRPGWTYRPDPDRARPRGRYR